MQTFGLVLFIIMALICVASLIYLFVRTIKTIKNPLPKTINFKKEVKISLILIAINVISFTLMMIAIYPWAKINATGGEWAQAIIGSFFCALGFAGFTYAFTFHYWGKSIPEKLNKWLFISVLISVPLCLIFFFVMSNGYADYLTYPLANGISFTQGVTTPFTGKPSIAFYALFILGGALLCYAICDHRFYKQYGKHGILESTLLVAFPAGIIGARIAYVIGEWDKSFAARVANGEWWSIFAIWEGGLTILGGAIGGIVVGVLWFLWRKKQYSIWVAVDIIIPAILVAQSIGRWGNFFNCEVHGVASDISNWQWLPKVIQNNMMYSEYSMRYVGPDQIFVPLFFIESITNMLGYFVIAWFFGGVLKRYIEFGDLAFSYLIWYGFTRVFMEPLRDEHYNMGDGGYWSWFWSIIFVVVGMVLIVGNHVVRFILRKRKKNYVARQKWFGQGITGTLFILAFSIGMIAPGAYLLATNEFVQKLSINAYNTGIILLASGLSLLAFSAVSVFFTIEGFKAKRQALATE